MSVQKSDFRNQFSTSIKSEFLKIFFLLKSINLGQKLLALTFFNNSNFWIILFSKNEPNFLQLSSVWQISKEAGGSHDKVQIVYRMSLFVHSRGGSGQNSMKSGPCTLDSFVIQEAKVQKNPKQTSFFKTQLCAVFYFGFFCKTRSKNALCNVLTALSEIMVVLLYVSTTQLQAQWWQFY